MLTDGVQRGLASDHIGAHHRARAGLCALLAVALWVAPSRAVGQEGDGGQSPTPAQATVAPAAVVPTPSPSPQAVTPAPLIIDESAPPPLAPAPQPGVPSSPSSPSSPLGPAPTGAPSTYDAAADLEVSLTSYYQKYLGRARPNTQAYQDNYPWWALFFGVWPIPVLPVEGEYVAEAIRERIETGRFQVLPVEAGVPATAGVVGQHLEAVALARAKVEAEQEGRFNVDLKGLDIYEHHVEAIREAGFVYRMSLTDVVVLTDRNLSRFVAYAACEVELYRVILGDPVRYEPITTLRVDGGGVAVNVFKMMEGSDARRASVDGAMRLAVGAMPGMAGPALVPVSLGGTLLGGLGARGIAMARAVRSMLDYLSVELSEQPGFRLEAPVAGVKGRRITFPMGTFEGLTLDHGLDVYQVSPRSGGICPEGMGEEPAPGVCGKKVGYARVRDVVDNTDPDGGRRTPEREEIKVQSGQSEGAYLGPFDSTARVLIKKDMPTSPLGLKVYENLDSGHRLVILGGLMEGEDGTAGRLDLTWRRSISDLIPISELSFDINLGGQAGGSYLYSATLGLDKRLYVSRLGLGFGARAGMALVPEGCSGCRAIGGEVYGGLEFLLSEHVAVQANIVGQRFQRIDVSARLFQNVGGVAGMAFMW